MSFRTKINHIFGKHQLFNPANLNPNTKLGINKLNAIIAYNGNTFKFHCENDECICEKRLKTYLNSYIYNKNKLNNYNQNNVLKEWWRACDYKCKDKY